MSRYGITHSLLSAWQYAMKGNPYEDTTTEKDAYGDFLKVLRREPTETTEAMQNGLDFEDLVTDIINGGGDPDDKWFSAARKVAGMVGGGPLQYNAFRRVTVDGVDILLHGRLDALHAGKVWDIKFSKAYDRGKYLDSTQHPMYLKLVPETKEFTYVISDGRDVWTETYRREETADVCLIIADFLAWLKAAGLWDLYAEKWVRE